MMFFIFCFVRCVIIQICYKDDIPHQIRKIKKSLGIILLFFREIILCYLTIQKKNLFQDKLFSFALRKKNENFQKKKSEKKFLTKFFLLQILCFV